MTASRRGGTGSDVNGAEAAREPGSLPSEEKVLSALGGSARGPLKAKDLARDLDVASEAHGAFRSLLRDMEGAGLLYRVKGNRYAIPEKINLVVGRVSVIRSGDAFVAVEPPGKDVFVAAAALASAMDGDRAVARIESRPRGRNPAGRVIKVLERAHPTMVGTFHRSRRFGLVKPRNRSMTRDVLIPEGDEKGASEGEAVLVRITSYGDAKLNPVGEVEEVLGPLTDPGVDVLMVHYGHGLALHFPPGVEEAAESVALARDPATDPDREDRRDLLVFTIDPADAKDHDDALSVTRDEEDGLWEVGIHIADVAYYVDPGELIDAEALARGTSVYLVDRTVPMLPHALSSDVCSLKPDVDRAAVSLFVRLDERGRVRDFRFERSLIRSRHRLAYDDAQQVLDGATGLDEATGEALRRLAALARALRRKREERGSIDFDLPEARVVLGEGGEPVDIERILRLDSHRLIEDFMLLANEIVASECHHRRLPIPYRVHEPPSPGKLEALREFLASLGHTLPKRDIRPRDLQNVLERVRGRPEEKLISTVILRSMQRARYQASDLGHFGLAAEHYAHFTSPIRRYPDLVTHRVVVRALVEGDPVPRSWSEALESVARHSSEREQVATAAERDSVDLKKVEYMERHLGEEFTGTIAGVTSFGFFVLLDQVFVEGLVHVNTLDDDYYAFRQEEYALVGERRGRRFRLGDRVGIQVSRVDKEERHVDFLLRGVLP